MTVHSGDLDIPVPRNREAEEGVIGSIIQSRSAFRDAAMFCTADDFYDPALAEIFEVCRQLDDTDQVITAMTVMQTLREAGRLAHLGGAARLINLVEAVLTPLTVSMFARTVHEVSRTRRILQIQMRLGQYIAENPDDHDRLLSLVAKANLDLELLVDERASDEPLEGLSTWSALWHQYPREVVDWLVPDLLVAEDVFMLLGGEGGGKSWFLRQFCLALAAGVHPFRAHQRVTPVRSLLVDFENAPAMVAYESRLIETMLRRLGDFDDTLASVWLKEDGLDLRDPAQARQLERAVAETQPQLLVLGPLYKAFKRGRDDWETAAEDVREVLDRIRRRYHCALLIEHHMPKATGGSQDRPMSPYGSSVWQKWPSLGYIVHRQGENLWALSEFRGPRLYRSSIPMGLVRGGELPWTPVRDKEEYEFALWDHLKPKNGRKH